MGRNRKAAAEEEDAPTDLKWRPDAVEEGQTRGAAAKQRAKELRKAAERRMMERLERADEKDKAKQSSSETPRAESHTKTDNKSERSKSSNSGASSSTAAPIDVSDEAPQQHPAAAPAHEKLGSQWLEIIGYLRSAKDLRAMACVNTEIQQLIASSEKHLYLELHKHLFGLAPPFWDYSPRWPLAMKIADEFSGGLNFRNSASSAQGQPYDTQAARSQTLIPIMQTAPYRGG